MSFTGVAGPTFQRNSPPDDVCPKDVFELFFDRQVMDLFVEQTILNKYAGLLVTETVAVPLASIC